jgi:DNA polymerase-3 subunit beta
MAVIAERQPLIEVLERAQAIAARKSTIPILSNVRISVGPLSAHITATDLDTTYQNSVPVTSDETFTTCLPARKLFDIVKAMPEDTIRISVDGDKCTITSGKSRFRLGTLPAGDFPSVDHAFVDAIQLTFDPAKLRTALTQTLYSSSQEETRFTLQNVQLEILEHGRVSIIGTDGHRLARYVVDADGGEGNIGKTFMAPAKALLNWMSLKNVSDKVNLTAVTNHVRIDSGSHGTFLFRVPVGQFPKVAPLFDATESNPLVYTVAPQDLNDAVKRALLVADDRSHAVRLTFGPDSIQVASEAAETGALVEEVAATAPASLSPGDSVTIGFNGQYLVDFLSRQGETVRVAIKSPSDATALRTNDAYAIVMPLRV